MYAPTEHVARLSHLKYLHAFVLALLLGLSHPVTAQESEAVEEVVVTGSYIKRPAQEDFASPIDVIGSEDIERIGRTDIGALIATSPANSGSFFVRDTQSSGLQSAANINLRGLGASSTLVLLNGRRQTQGGIPNREGQVFVDVNGLVPLIMIDRIDVLKDGTSALYGSDAIAGVVNFVTRNDFEGSEVQLNYLDPDSGDGRITTVSGILGAGHDRGHLVAAIEYVDQHQIDNEARFSDERLVSGGFSSFYGTPATYQLIPGNNYNAPYDSLSGFIADPLCGDESIGGVRAGLLTGNAGGEGVCRLGLALGGQLFPAETRLNALMTGHYDIGETSEVFGEFGFSRIRTERTDSPSYPVSNATITVPAHNPGNFFGDEVLLFTRPIGVNSERPKILTNSDTWRVVAGIRGDLFGNSNNWTYEFAGFYSANDQFNTDNDELLDRFIAALNGEGGPNGDEYFNPFGSQFLSSPGDPTYNSPEVFDDFMIQRFRKTAAELTGVDGVLTGNLDSLQLGGGSVGLALGFNFRTESLEGDYDEPTKTPGMLANHNVEFPFKGDRDVSAIFMEALLPFTDTFELTGAVRYEDYGSGVDTFDYKLAALWRPADSLSLRASLGTSFRAPSLFEAFGGLTSNVIVPAPGGGTQVALQVTRGNPAADPEESDNLNVGFTWTPTDSLQFGLDYWSFDYENVLAQLNGLTIFLNDPNDPRIEYDPITGEVRRIYTSFENLSGLEAEGFDATASFGADTSVGQFSVDLYASIVTTYDIRPLATDPVIDGVGSRNQSNFASPMPEYRANLTLSWFSGGHSASATYRVIDGIEDDVPNNISENKSFNTLDLRYSYRWDWADSSTMFRVGIENATDEDAPLTSGTINTYEGRVHDARGRIFVAGLTHSF